jgi:ketosteroid isomerase-like protein
MSVRALAAIGLLVTVVACAPAGSKPSAELAAAGERWEAATNSGDIGAFKALYAEDARLLPPNAELQRGGDAVEASFGELVDAGLKGDLETIEAVVAGDIGYRVGTYVLTAQDGSLVDRGKYIETWKMIDGEWKITNDVWNSDLPPPPPTGSTVIITHEVKNADTWLAAWTGDESREDMFKRNGVLSARSFQCPDKPKHTGLLLQVEDMGAFQAMLESPEGVEAKAEDGVKDRTIMAFAEVD